MKKLILILLTLALVCLTAVSCDNLPDEVKEILGIVIEIPDTGDTDNGESGGTRNTVRYATSKNIEVYNILEIE